ncbi:MAG: phosphodiester glycosidase family protein [Potamolinea sp.]
MNHRYQIGIKYFLVAASAGILLLPLILYGWLHFIRPPRTTQERALFQGIVYKREVHSTPRPLIIHIVSVDLSSPGVKALVTPGTSTSKKTEIPTEIDARTTSEFLQEFKLQFAVKGGFFYRFREVTPWDYYPHSGDSVNVVGQAISNGSAYSEPEPKLPVLCFNTSKGSYRAQILGGKDCPQGTVHALAGNNLLIERGNPVGLTLKAHDTDRPYPRVAVGIDKAGEKLWFVAIDGKQPLYSEGATIAELTKVILDLGADWAINLDGGGSTTLVAATPSGTSLLNSPIQAKLPMNERSVGNHIGFYALPSDK